MPHPSVAAAGAKQERNHSSSRTPESRHLRPADTAGSLRSCHMPASASGTRCRSPTTASPRSFARRSASRTARRRRPTPRRRPAFRRPPRTPTGRRRRRAAERTTGRGGCSRPCRSTAGRSAGWRRACSREITRSPNSTPSGRRRRRRRPTLSACPAVHSLRPLPAQCAVGLSPDPFCRPAAAPAPPPAVTEMRPHCGEEANSYRNAMLELCVWVLGCWGGFFYLSPTQNPCLYTAWY